METSLSPLKSPPRSIPWLTLAIALVAISESLLPTAQEHFVYDRNLIEAGQWWRLWSGHLAHFNLSHLCWNLVVFLPAGMWAERIHPHQTRLFLIAAPGFISTLLWHFNPHLQRYLGISGVAVGTLTLLTLFELRRSRPGERWPWGVILVLLIAKLAAEFGLPGTAFFVHFSPGFQNVPLSHLGGAVFAAAVFVLSAIQRTGPTRSTHEPV